MMKRQDGFSLIELIVAVAVFSLVIAAAAGVFVPLVNQFKQQSKTAETNIEGIVGLELLRLDIEHAGYGLPWSFQNSIAYSEASFAPASDFNDSPSDLPRAILSADSMTYGGLNNIFDGSDYLVIKSSVVGGNDASQKWTYIVWDPFSRIPQEWDNDDENLDDGDRVIVIRPKVGESRQRELVMNSGTFYATFSSMSFPLAFSPINEGDHYVIYGIDAATDPVPRMPFNRADYFIRRFDSSGTNITPRRCSSSTGVLEKVVISHSDGMGADFLPLLDCVADMQIIYRLDMDEDGEAETFSNADGSIVASDEGSSATNVQDTMADAGLLRKRLREVRVFILAHEGQIDRFYTFDNFTAGACPTCVRLGDSLMGRDYDLSVIPDYLNYRWKVYTLVVIPQNLGEYEKIKE